MRSVALVAGCAALIFVACGDGNGTAGGDDGFCAGAEQTDAASEEFESILADVVEMVSEEPPNAPARREAVETFLRLGDLSEEALDGIDGMVADSDGGLRRDLEAVAEYNREMLTPLIEAESAEEIDAALEQSDADPPPELAGRAQRIDDATEERCGVAFVRNPFEAIIEGATRGPVPWPDVDMCELLTVEALTEAGVVDTEGTVDEDGPPNLEDCEWGERYAPDGTYLRVALWDPPFPEVFEDLWEERGEVAGRTTYVESARALRLSCHLAIDNGEYVITATVDLGDAPDDDAACRVAESAAASALSSVTAQG